MRRAAVFLIFLTLGPLIGGVFFIIAYYPTLLASAIFSPHFYYFGQVVVFMLYLTWCCFFGALPSALVGIFAAFTVDDNKNILKKGNMIYLCVMTFSLFVIIMSSNKMITDFTTILALTISLIGGLGGCWLISNLYLRSQRAKSAAE